jgi:hypothetical protein
MYVHLRFYLQHIGSRLGLSYSWAIRNDSDKRQRAVDSV